MKKNPTEINPMEIRKDEEKKIEDMEPSALCKLLIDKNAPMETRAEALNELLMMVEFGEEPNIFQHFITLFNHLDSLPENFTQKIISMLKDGNIIDGYIRAVLLSTSLSADLKRELWNSFTSNINEFSYYKGLSALIQIEGIPQEYINLAWKEYDKLGLDLGGHIAHFIASVKDIPIELKKEMWHRLQQKPKLDVIDLRILANGEYTPEDIREWAKTLNTIDKKE